jgi:DNA mismatch repair protein MutS2
VKEAREIERQVTARRPARPKSAAPAVEPLTAGAWVRLRTLGQIGQIVSISGAHADVQAGVFKLRARIDDLERVTRAERDAAEAPAPRGYSLPAPTGPIPQSQIEIRGWRAEQVAPELDRYLNDAYMAGLPFVRIVHGKGTGVLRQVVREHLAGHPLVQSFESAEQRDGGEGVTIAALAH